MEKMFSSGDHELNHQQKQIRFVSPPSDGGSKKHESYSVFAKTSKKINEIVSSTVGLKKSTTNLTPSDESNKKKKRFSIQKCSQMEEENTQLTLVDLPLLALSYICTNLNVAERDTFSQVCIKFAVANRMSWFRRSRLNIRSDIASYILQYDGIDDVFDESFDFVSMNLLKDKVQLVSSYFNVPRLISVDFSLPKNSVECHKRGDILILTRESFRQSMENVQQNIIDVNLCDVLITKEVLKECSQLFPWLSSISLSMHTLIWPSSSSTGVTNFDIVNAKTVQNWNQTNKQILPNVVDLLSFLYLRFPRLKHVNLLD